MSFQPGIQATVVAAFLICAQSHFLVPLRGIAQDDHSCKMCARIDVQDFLLYFEAIQGFPLHKNIEISSKDQGLVETVISYSAV